MKWKKILNPFKAGKTSKNFNSPSEQYAMITLPRDFLEFDCKKGIALCVGIDRQRHRHYASQSLGNIVIRDVEAMGKAFVDSLGLSENQVKVRVTSAHDADCTKRGVRALFMESAKKVEKSGIFIFFFAGHGYLVKDRCMLAPADFAGMEDLTTVISGDNLVEWLYEAECKAKQVLVILDCCFAGDLGTTLTSDKMLQIKPGLFVMCGCAAGENSMSIGALGHSIFTYFFLQYLETHQCRGGFAVKQAMEEITEMCFNFSSLLVSYEKGELQLCEMHPTLDRLESQLAEISLSMDETDSGRLELLVQLFQRGQRKAVPHPEVDKWLKSPAVNDSLCMLYSKASFSETLHEGILCSMLYSAASIQYGYDKTRLEERNLFIIIAINVLATVSLAYPEVNTTISHLISGLHYYSQPTFIGGVDRSSLNKLLQEMRQLQVPNEPVPDDTDNSHDIATNENGGDEVDGPVTQPTAVRKVTTKICDYSYN